MHMDRWEWWLFVAYDCCLPIAGFVAGVVYKIRCRSTGKREDGWELASQVSSWAVGWPLGVALFGACWLAACLLCAGNWLLLRANAAMERAADMAETAISLRGASECPSDGLLRPVGGNEPPPA